jgi:hypothetical protein
MMSARTLTRPLLAATVFASAGCYNYAQVEPSAVPPGVEVRVHLTREGTLPLMDVAPVTGTSVTGTLVGMSEGLARLYLPRGVRVEGAATRTIGQEVTIPARDIVRIEERLLSRTRTALAIGGAAALIIAVATGFDVGMPNSQQPRIPPDELRLPSLSRSPF